MILLDTQKYNVLVLLTCIHFAHWDILSSIILRITNWTWYHLMFESHIGHYFFPNGSNLSPSVTRIWRRGKKTRINVPCRKWIPQMAPLPNNAFETVVALLIWVEVAERSHFNTGKSFGNFPRPKFYLYFLLLMSLCGFTSVRSDHTLPFLLDD